MFHSSQGFLVKSMAYSFNSYNRFTKIDRHIYQLTVIQNTSMNNIRNNMRNNKILFYTYIGYTVYHYDTQHEYNNIVLVSSTS